MGVGVSVGSHEPAAVVVGQLLGGSLIVASTGRSLEFFGVGFVGGKNEGPV